MVPDQALSEAVSALQHVGFNSCTQGRQCRFAHDTVEFCSSPPPAAHLHMTGPNVVMLFRKSDMLWNAPAVIKPTPLPEGPNAKIILASDRKYLPGQEPGLGQGAFSTEFYPVRIPSAHCLVEAYSSLMLQDWSNDYGIFWMSMLAYIMQYVDAKGRLDLNQVESRRRNFYCELRGGKVGTAQAIKNFKTAMESSSSTTPYGGQKQRPRKHVK